jgi:glycosyltransferase involved in cell wall biosynthesis
VTSRPLNLVVAGVHLGGAGYPNAIRTVQALQARQDVHVVQCGRWLPDTFRLWSLTRASMVRRLQTLVLLAFGNLWSGLVALRQARKWRAPVYVPYPSVPLLWLYSFLPHRVRPLLVADAYISLWDSLVVDRGGARAQGRFAKLLRGVEGRALRTADVVLTDTQANRDYLVDIFAIESSRVRSLPLAVVEPDVCRTAVSPPPVEGGPLEVLFVGSFVPLHGISSLLLGITPLIHDPSFRFTVIGDGQDADQVERFLQDHPCANVRWVREWQQPAQLAQWVQAADVCLGVFGGTGKASRVLPFKLYMYLAYGRAVVTQGTLSLPAGVPMPPVLTVQSERPQQITQALQFLRDNPAEKSRLQHDATRFYRAHLSNARVAEIWIALLREIGDKAGDPRPASGAHSR